MIEAAAHTATVIAVIAVITSRSIALQILCSAVGPGRAQYTSSLKRALGELSTRAQKQQRSLPPTPGHRRRHNPARQSPLKHRAARESNDHIQLLAPHTMGHATRLFVVILAANTIITASREIFVHPAAQGQLSTGEREQPFATLEQARDWIRSTPRLEPTTVYLLEDLELARPFTLDSRDSGTPENPVTYASGPGLSRKKLTGGKRLDPASFTPHTMPSGATGPSSLLCSITLMPI